MRWIVEISIAAIALFYTLLAGGGLSGFLLWVYLALVFLALWSCVLTLGNIPKTPAFWGFFVGANLFMLPVHVSWYFDIDGARTGSSTSALIFAVMPVWAFIFGGVTSGVFKLASNRRRPKKSGPPSQPER